MAKIPTLRTFHSKESLFFTREADGGVTITKTDGKSTEEGGRVLFEQTLDEGIWVSVVLTMSAFDERSGDFAVWMRHHRGEQDVLEGDCYYVEL